jgi:manganese/zinc/iron transport system permease protein
MIGLAALIGSGCGVAGAVLSSVWDRLPTGPTIVLLLSVVVVISLTLAPSRGLVWRRLRRATLRDAPQLDPVLMHLHALALQHGDDPEHGHSVSVLATMSHPAVDVEAVLRTLQARGLAVEDDAGRWAPSALGRREAQRLLARTETSEETGEATRAGAGERAGAEAPDER